jgi:hypothetical protein
MALLSRYTDLRGPQMMFGDCLAAAAVYLKLKVTTIR